MKLLYKPFGIIAGVIGGMIATKLFQQIWMKLTGSKTTANPKSPQSGWAEVATGAAVHGAVYGAVKAITDRSAAKAFASTTGTWPDGTREVA